MMAQAQQIRDGGREPADVGILILETTFPRLPGDVGNPETFSFPVDYIVVAGATPQRVVESPDPELLDSFLQAARDMQDSGARALATSCGFLAIYHQELVRSVRIPVFTSSLLQVHLLAPLLRPGQAAGVITASKRALTRSHLAGVGIENHPLVIAGMDEAEEFSAVFLGGKETLDREKCRREMVKAALDLQRDHPEVGGIVLECANMPPYSADIRRATGLPVFDAVSLICLARAAVKRI